MQFSVFVQELLELKRLQIRAPKANEEVIVKQLTERFNGTMKSLASQGETTIELSEKYNTYIFS